MESYQMKKYIWSALGVIGIVFFWAGIWDGLGNLWLLTNPLGSLAAGVLILFVSALAFGKLSFKRAERSILSLMHKVHAHPQKHSFHIKYHDKHRKKDVLLSAYKLHAIDKSFLVLKEKGREVFVPIHRVSEVLLKGKGWKG